MASNRSPGFRGTKLERCSRLCGFREKNVLRFSYISLCKIDKPRAGQFLAQGSLLEQTWERTIWQGWHDIDRPGFPWWENPGKRGLDNILSLPTSGQYWAI